MERYALHFLGSQGGGVLVASNAVANFEGCDIHDNAVYQVCLPSALALNFHPSPDGTLCAPLFGLQGGGVYVSSDGVANFEGCDIHDNTAYYVCLPSALALNFHPSPHWNADFCYVRYLAGCELSRESNPCVTFHRPTGLLTVTIFVCGRG